MHQHMMGLLMTVLYGSAAVAVIASIAAMARRQETVAFVPQNEPPAAPQNIPADTEADEREPGSPADKTAARKVARMAQKRKARALKRKDARKRERQNSGDGEDEAA
jgi:hypothetical protein